MIDPDKALNQFDESKILNDDYPSDLSQTYYLINGLKSYGNRTTDYVMVLEKYVSSSIYQNKDGGIYAMIWNVSDRSEQVTFKGPDGFSIKHTVEARSFGV